MVSPARLVTSATLMAIASWACLVSAATAAPPTPAELRELVARQAQRPSVHGEAHELQAALESAGLPADEIDRLWRDVAITPVPGIGGRLDVFLFLTRDPTWRRVRGTFAEFLDLPEMRTLTAAHVEPLLDFDGVVSLPALTTLDADVAAAFDAFGATGWGAALEFSGLAELTPDVAAALSRCDGLLVFPSLRSLSLESARALARHEGMGIVIGGLPRLSADVAAALAECRSLRGLMLPDLEVIDSLPLVRRLVRQDSVFLPRVADLGADVAAELHGVDGSGELSLPGLARLPPEVARPLAEPGFYSITLGCASTLGPKAAAALAGHPGPLTFTGPESFPAAAARELALRDADILLPHLAALPDDVAAALVPHAGSLVLGGVTTLSVQEARALAAHAGPIIFESLRSLEPAAAAALAARAGMLVLPALAPLDAGTAAALARLRGDLVLDGLAAVSVDVAEALARHEGLLSLGGLRDLPADVAAALAEHRGGLVLDGVTSLSTPAALALSRGRGRLSLMGLVDIEPRGLKLLLARGNVDMPPAEDLSVGVESALDHDDVAIPAP